MTDLFPQTIAGWVAFGITYSVVFFGLSLVIGLVDMLQPRKKAT